ncbi:MAG: ORF6N domain-containing protein [Elusimicrobia bacterium]|nr:ORF6N domain-containing protein [Elusimicrobiota bacterium]
MKSLISLEHVERRIYLIRGHKVMLDSDLAELYGVTTGNLNLTVHRNKDRFPDDFAFRLTAEETDNLRLQIASSRWGGRRYLPYVFTQEGIAMLSGVLHTKRAIAVNVLIMRTFVKLREMLSTHKELAKKLEELEKRMGTYDQQILRLFETIRELMAPSLSPYKEPKRKIGYQPNMRLRGPLTWVQ